MTLLNKIALFIVKAQTKLRELQTSLIGEFDRRGYQNDRSEDLLLKISETYDFIELLVTDDRGELTEKETRDLIDFFIKWLDLNKVIAANYVNYQLPIQSNIILPSGSVATSLDLAAEILARIAADSALSARIDAIVIFDPSTIFPVGFFSNYVASYAVIFDDDPRIHSHANKVELDAIVALDIVNIQALVGHFLSIGTPGGLHVSQEDRDKWDAIVGEAALRIAEDIALNLRIDNILPVGFLDNFVADYSVVFNDDLRLHIHVNKTELDQLTDLDIINIKALEAHFLNVGQPFGIHVSQEDRDRWDAAVAEGDPEVYELTSPSTVTVGGMPAGTALTGRSWQSIIEEILVDYLNPAFSSFSVTDMPALVEVGISISGVRNFAWGTSNSGNVQANSIAIRDVTAATYIATSLANDGGQAIDVGVIPNIAPLTHSWRAEGVNSILAVFNSGQDSVTSIYPYFYGKVASGGLAPGLGRPVANQALIDSGTKVVGVSSSTITINFASTSDDYAWFAIPASMASKLSWYINDLNNGSIGGVVGAGGNLFPNPDVVSIDSPTVLWAGVNYKIYVANYQSSIAIGMQLRNA